MNRREFLKNTSKGAVGLCGLPYLLPSGRLFAPTGARVANHVVFCLFAGGVRNQESIHMADGNLMPNLLKGTAPISPDIADGMEALPLLTNSPLQTLGTLFKEFRFSEGPAGHYQGHMTAITGHYVDNNVNFSIHSVFPTLFEYYRKHNSPQMSALNAWWVSNGLGENENLAYSIDPAYGPKFAANFFSPAYLIYNAEPVHNCRTFSGTQKPKIEKTRNFLNSQFKAPSLNLAEKFSNNPDDQIKVQDLITNLVDRAFAGEFNNPWGLGDIMNHDMFNVLLAEEVMKKFKPELMVVNMTEVDVCHEDFTASCNNLRKADYAAAHLWQTIQNTPGMANDTIMIIAPEHGRNLQHNSIRDQYGRYAIDHGDDEASKEIFCMVLGPSGKIYQNQVINSVKGQSIDIVPTIGHILGFGQDVPGGLLPGKVLEEAFI